MKYYLTSACVLSALWLAACTTSPTTKAAPEADSTPPAVAPVVRDSVTGTVAYRERIALPPAAVVRLQLQDVSRQDVAATIIDSVTIRPDGKQVPIPFTLRYDPARIQENSTYSVQARIIVDGNLLFINDVSYPVITRGNPKQVQMMLRRAQ